MTNKMTETSDDEESVWYPPVTEIDIMDSMFGKNVEANGTPQSVHSWSTNAFPVNTTQQRCFEILAAKFVLTYCAEAEDALDISSRYSTMIVSKYKYYKQLLQEMVGKKDSNDQLIMFLTGATGSGKHEIIRQFLQYAERFCINIHQPFTRDTVCLTTCVGHTAARNNGRTLHNTFFSHGNDRDIPHLHKKRFRDNVKMVVLDDVQQFSPADLKRIQKRLQLLTNNTFRMFGGVHMVFVGDFKQLLPVRRKPLYESTEFASTINCLVELPYPSKLQEDSVLFDICRRFYEGCPREEDYRILNKRHVPSIHSLPQDITAICTSRQRRDNINSSFWLRYICDNEVQCAIVILADHLYSPFEIDRDYFDKRYASRKTQFSNMLQCHYGSRHMLTVDLDVNSNLVVGTEGRFINVIVRPGEKFHFKRIQGVNVPCIYASQVDHVLWEVDNKTVPIKPVQYITDGSYSPGGSSIQLPFLSSSAKQLNMVCDPATNPLYVTSWKYSHGWIYYLLTRISKLDQLFVEEPLVPGLVRQRPDSLQRMMEQLRYNASPSSFDYTKLSANRFVHTEEQVRNTAHKHHVNFH